MNGDIALKILVTGGAGYIGSHTCKALAARGHVPITYDNLSRGNRWAVKWGPFEEGDIRDSRRLEEVLEIHKPDAVMHFAAFAYVGESVEKPLLYYENNVGGTASLLRGILCYRKIPFVFSSTCATYGIPEQMPISENAPQRPVNPYGYSKLFVERILADLERAAGLPWVALRYFNAAGADPDGEIGEAHDPEPHLIPLIIRAAQTGAPVTIFGDDYETPDGTCIRDYIHVTDLADAHVAALDYLMHGGKSGAFNLANARGYSVKEVVACVEKVTAQPVPIEVAARRPGDPAILIGDGSRARDILRWSPRRSDLSVQIRDAWNWSLRKQPV
jgi:UDP-arabinose 4-epimerase